MRVTKLLVGLVVVLAIGGLAKPAEGQECWQCIYTDFNGEWCFGCVGDCASALACGVHCAQLSCHVCQVWEQCPMFALGGPNRSLVMAATIPEILLDSGGLLIVDPCPKGSDPPQLTDLENRIGGGAPSGPY